MTTESIGDEGITSEKGDVEEKDDIERPLEVESLCMNCYKNVRVTKSYGAPFSHIHF